MTFNEWALLAILCIAAGQIAVGVALMYPPAGFVVAGVLCALIAVLFFLDVGGRP